MTTACRRGRFAIDALRGHERGLTPPRRADARAERIAASAMGFPYGAECVRIFRATLRGYGSLDEYFIIEGGMRAAGEQAAPRKTSALF